MIVQTGRATTYDIKEFQINTADLDSNSLPNIVLTANNTGSSALNVDTGDYFKWHIDKWYKL